ncbi:MAG TPA: flagellar basal body P-ring protein FlgI [Caulobacteraceae bacterium]|jgi:flagellar P-ring protein precursor FlgI|nr:flagellar basal body P-ring protein FlgI [Caulobacteraceae bacterium]
MRLRILRWSILWVSVLAVLAGAPASAASRIKDIVQFEGVRENKLVGYGLVVGLNGTGDSLRNAPMTQQSMIAMLERLGVNTRGATMDTKDIAAVMVTASLPAFAATGSTVDVTVSAMADAKSLLGGTLLVTPLLGADGEAYAVAQGSVETGATSATGASGSTITKGVPTAGRIAAGANVEREVGFSLARMDVLRLTLRNPDFTTSRRVADVINSHYPGTALSENPTIVAIRPPAGRDMVSFITEVENYEIEPDEPAKVVIDEVTGVVVIGDKVRLSTVAIAQGNLTIQVNEQPQVSQPTPFSQGVTTVVPQSTLKVDEQKGKKLIIVKGGASLSSLVQGLNALGVTPRDMISILQAIKADGALQADIQVM